VTVSLVVKMGPTGTGTAVFGETSPDGTDTEGVEGELTAIVRFGLPSDLLPEDEAAAGRCNAGDIRPGDTSCCLSSAGLAGSEAFADADLV
jgi:hypothetical protein